ncbi:hypothetical protein CASFOL_008936 [Castilleja foliolosa]|uniref:KIB1-4 beta-propeller domain-containing protein n=1 Tax=Castilleja foliolosa TaxID=1961234 RepID=A0ABD3E0D6_9LAMI
MSLRPKFNALNSYRRSRKVSTVIRSMSALMARILNRSDEAPVSSSSRCSPPWLMLSPSSNNTSYDLYSFSKNRVITIPKSEKKSEFHGTKIVGSSHGWLACFNRRGNELFLSNPLSGLRVNLPPIRNLSIPDPSGVGLKKILISCFDPESEECRAMMLFDVTNRLVFCCPGRSTEWAIIESSYQDFVYCGTHKLLFSIKNSIKLGLELEAWDLRNPRSPSLVWSCGVDKLEVGYDSVGPYKPSPEVGYYDSKGNPNTVQENVSCSDHQNYVVVSQQGELFLVYRYINRYMLPDGSCAPMDPDESITKLRYPPKTVNYKVYKIVREGYGAKKVFMDGHLDGLVMFIGCLNNGMAMPAADADGFQPDTICFTDDSFTISKSVRGTDNGIYDYKNKTFHPCYYPCDYQSLKKKILPPPLWLTPH